LDLIFAKDLIKKYRMSVLALLGGFIFLGLAVPSFIKPRYKVTSVISISPSYFQNSLMREFLSEVYDASELRSQRQSLISQSLDQNALDEISAKAGMTPAQETPLEASLRRQKLLNSIEIFPLQSSDFQISVTSNSRERGLLINQEVLGNILKVLKAKRMRGLENLRAAIGVQLDSLMPLGELTSSTSPSSVSPASIKMKLSQLQQEVEQKRVSFAPSHPVLIAKEKELKNLQMLYEAAKNRPSEEGSVEEETKPYNALSQIPENTVYNDLSRKYSYLNIVILAESGPNPSYFSVVRSPELPPAPIWPKRSLFLIWSLLLGTLTAVAYVAMKEFVFVTAPSPDVSSGAPVFRGSLQNFDFVEPLSASTERPRSHDSDL
jgi:uncharacterized protein involved in exopolysaccharide biosynthesis